MGSVSREAMEPRGSAWKTRGPVWTRGEEPVTQGRPGASVTLALGVCLMQQLEPCVSSTAGWNVKSLIYLAVDQFLMWEVGLQASVLVRAVAL